MKVSDVAEISRLRAPEKILFVEELWDSIASSDSEIPVNDSHKEEQDNRFEKHYTAGE